MENYIISYGPRVLDNKLYIEIFNIGGDGKLIPHNKIPEPITDILVGIFVIDLRDIGGGINLYLGLKSGVLGFYEKITAVTPIGFFTQMTQFTKPSPLVMKGF